MRKYYFIVLISFLCVLLLLNSSNVRAVLPLSGKLIIIDPGHGGKDVGTVYDDIYEKDLNLDISKKLSNVLIKNGATVILTREGDYDLSYPNSPWRKKSDFDNRIRLINESQGDLYLSIHLNYLSDSSYYGPQVFYDQDNRILAEKIQSILNKKTQNNRKIKNIPKTTYMYSKLKIPGVLIECGFISNAQERQKLLTDKYQQEIVEHIKDGLLDYYY